jgi:hypothetical protein
MTRKILRSAKITNIQWLTVFDRSLMNTLKRKGPRTEPCGTQEVTLKGSERVPEIQTRHNNNNVIYTIFSVNIQFSSTQRQCFPFERNSR